MTDFLGIWYQEEWSLVLFQRGRKRMSSSLDSTLQGRCKHQGNLIVVLKSISQIFALLFAVIC